MRWRLELPENEGVGIFVNVVEAVVSGDPSQVRALGLFGVVWTPERVGFLGHTTVSGLSNGVTSIFLYE